MKPKAIIFDVDGTIANSERWGHLPACNEAFKMLSLPIEWDWQTFKKMLIIPGNANRLRHELTSMNTYSSSDIDAYIDAFVPMKKELYITKYLPNVKLREGITDFIKIVIDAHIKLAVVSTSYEAQINELFKAKLADVKDYFNPILGKESGIKTGYEGILYEKCLHKLGLDGHDCVVIEDSRAGLKAAARAHIPTVVFYNEYTKNEDFSKAVLVAPSVTSIDIDKIIHGDYSNVSQN
jgi:HAD superfamily hydrolase (TIGR01509 family)